VASLGNGLDRSNTYFVSFIAISSATCPPMGFQSLVVFANGTYLLLSDLGGFVTGPFHETIERNVKSLV